MIRKFIYLLYLFFTCNLRAMEAPNAFATQPKWLAFLLNALPENKATFDLHTHIINPSESKKRSYDESAIESDEEISINVTQSESEEDDTTIIASAERKFNCTYDGCYSSFKRRYHLEEHERMHTQERPYKCPKCVLSFIRQGNWSEHIRTQHVRKNKYFCPYRDCNKAFRYKQSYDNHLCTHSEARPFVCEICSASFKDPSNLRQHAYVHSNEQPFDCKLCSSKYKRSNDLTRHMRTKHKRNKHTDE